MGDRFRYIGAFEINRVYMLYTHTTSLVWKQNPYYKMLQYPILDQIRWQWKYYKKPGLWETDLGILRHLI